MYSLRPIRILFEKHAGDQLINVSAQKDIIIIPAVVWLANQESSFTMGHLGFPKFKIQNSSPSGRLDLFLLKRLVCSRVRKQSFLTPPLYSFETFKLLISDNKPQSKNTETPGKDPY